MTRFYMTAAKLLILLALTSVAAEAQLHWIVGGRLGMSIFTGGAQAEATNFLEQLNLQNVNTPSSTRVGLQIGPTAEVVFSKQFAIGTEFNINTQAGTPIEWTTFFKVYFPISGSKILPYADMGFDLLFVTGGPWFGVRAGGGAMFPIAKNLYIPADLQLAPIFTTGSVTFMIVITSGIRYVI